MRAVPRTSVLRVVVAATMALVAVFGFAGAASAQSDSDYSGETTVVPSVKPQVEAQALNQSSGAVAAEQSSAQSAQSLAFTGGDALRLALLGGGLVLVGGAAVVVVRRRTAVA